MWQVHMDWAHALNVKKASYPTKKSKLENYYALFYLISNNLRQFQTIHLKSLLFKWKSRPAPTNVMFLSSGAPFATTMFERYIF